MMARSWLLRLIKITSLFILFSYSVSAYGYFNSSNSCTNTDIDWLCTDCGTTDCPKSSGTCPNDLLCDGDAGGGVFAGIIDLNNVYNNNYVSEANFCVESTDNADYLVANITGNTTIHALTTEARLCAKGDIDAVGIVSCEFDLFIENNSIWEQLFDNNGCADNDETICSGWLNSSFLNGGARYWSKTIVESGYSQCSNIAEIWLEQRWNSCDIPASGDWEITGGDQCTLSSLETITGNLNISDGSLTVQNGGTLTASGGYLYVYSGSNITIESGGQING